MSDPRPKIALRHGALRGVAEDRTVAFRGIPYAASPVGELRFRPPVAHPGWDGVRDAASSGPSVPQRQSRLQNVMGPSPMDWSEHDCLNLNIWAPEAALTDGRLRPVLFWIHGGGWTSGSGGWDWYDGGRLAAGGDIVVVTINYRLSALGYLWLPEIGAGNIGARDQGAALQWVYDNIAAFGGDPNNVTVGGQSAGAYSALSLALDPATRPLVRKVLAQSGPWTVAGQEPSAAMAAAGDYLDLLGITHNDVLSALQDVPVVDLLTAYHALPRHPQRPTDPAPPMYPVRGGAGLPRNLMESLDLDGLCSTPLLIGRTENEMAAFTPGIADPEDADDATRVELDDGIVRIAETCAAQGHPAYVYRFARRSSSTAALGSTHCAELPFLFDNLEAYEGAPMTGPADESDHELAHEFSSMIARFVRSGVPDGRRWAPYRPSDGRYVRRYDSVAASSSIGSV